MPSSVVSFTRIQYCPPHPGAGGDVTMMSRSCSFMVSAPHRDFGSRCDPPGARGAVPRAPRSISGKMKGKGSWKRDDVAPRRACARIGDRRVDLVERPAVRDQLVKFQPPLRIEIDHPRDIATDDGLAHLGA